jgi:hypothetical protein
MGWRSPQAEGSAVFMVLSMPDTGYPAQYVVRPSVRGSCTSKHGRWLHELETAWPYRHDEPRRDLRLHMLRCQSACVPNFATRLSQMPRIPERHREKERPLTASFVSVKRDHRHQRRTAKMSNNAGCRIASHCCYTISSEPSYMYDDSIVAN